MVKQLNASREYQEFKKREKKYLDFIDEGLILIEYANSKEHYEESKKLYSEIKTVSETYIQDSLKHYNFNIQSKLEEILGYKPRILQ